MAICASFAGREPKASPPILRQTDDQARPCRGTSTELWRPKDPVAYSYLLGIYLGDGYVGRHERTWSLQLELDSTYPGIIRECASAIERVLPVVVGEYRRPGSNGVRLYAYSRLWPEVFPQHGTGKKHARPIRLSDWQADICDRHPRQLLRGLIHSDGSRSINRFKVLLPSGRLAEYAYVRYFFTNYSADIQGIFCGYCDRLGLRWTQSSRKNISIADRRSVAILDSFVGSKE